MRKNRFTEEQIIKVLKEHAAGLSAGELCRKHDISDATFYKWRSRYGVMEISDARKLKALEEENRKGTAWILLVPFAGRRLQNTDAGGGESVLFLREIEAAEMQSDKTALYRQRVVPAVAAACGGSTAAIA